jgi:hypothetical protein
MYTVSEKRGVRRFLLDEQDLNPHTTILRTRGAMIRNNLYEYRF